VSLKFGLYVQLFYQFRKKYLLVTSSSAPTDRFKCAFKNDVYPFLWCINRELIKFESDPVKTWSNPQRYSKDDDDDDDDDDDYDDDNNNNNSIIVFIIRFSQLSNGQSQKQHNVQKPNERERQNKPNISK